MPSTEPFSYTSCVDFVPFDILRKAALALLLKIYLHSPITLASSTSLSLLTSAAKSATAVGAIVLKIPSGCVAVPAAAPKNGFLEL